MKSLLSYGVLFLACALAAIPVGAASFTETNFDSFFADFKSAVARDDAKAVAALTQLPFLFDGQPRDSIAFQKIYPQLFDAKVRNCFAKARAVIEQDAQVINCGRYIFYFRVVNRQYRFIEFAADPEAAP